jgi:phosphatidylglycerol:prolipoprotein diacylglycerol transferase
VQPEIDVAGVTIQTFGICFALGFLASGAIIARRLPELGLKADWAYEMVFAALIGGIVGARLYYLAEHWDEASDDLFGSIFSGSGLTWYGGAIGGALAMLLWAWRRHWVGLDLLDTCAVPLAVGYAIGRIGCQISGDGDYGKPWDGPWAMAYPDGTVPTDEEVHPTPIYETLAMCLGAWLLWRLRDRFVPGAMFASYLVLAGAERFLVELLRRNEDALLGLTQPQLISILMLVVGGGWLAVLRRRGGVLRPAALVSGAPAPAT